MSRDFARFAKTESVSADLKRKSVVGALTTGVGTALDFVLRLGSTLVLARLLVPEHFGLVAMVAAIAQIAERFSDLGLSTATVQAPEIDHAQCSNLFWINFCVGLLFAAAMVLFAPQIAVFFGEPRLRGISIAIASSFVFTGLSLQHQALLMRQMKLTQLAANRLASTTIGICVAVGLAWADFGYWALVWKQVAQSCALAGGAWMLCHWIPGRPSRRVNMGRLLRFGRDLTVTQFLFAATSQLDNVLIGKISGAIPLGWYRQAYNLMMTPIESLNAPISSVSQPSLSILQFEPARYRRYYRRVLVVVSLITFPVGLFTVIYAHEIVLVALGEPWLGSVVFLRLFGVVAMIQPSTGTTGMILVTRGRTGRYLRLHLVYNITLIGLMFLGTIWGAVGVATARVTALLLVSPWALYYALHDSPVSTRDFLGAVSKPLMASFAMGATALLSRNFLQIDNRIASLAVGFAVAAGTYVVSLALLPGGRKELGGLAAELLTALRRRSSKESEPTGGAAG